MINNCNQKRFIIICVACALIISLSVGFVFYPNEVNTNNEFYCENLIPLSERTGSYDSKTGEISGTEKVVSLLERKSNIIFNRYKEQ